MVLIKRVVLGISGGVDSAVAGLLLKKRGYDVIGLFMKNWDVEDEQGFCSHNQDAEDAEWTCKKLGIPFHQVNFVKEYWNHVFSYLLDEYQRGRTPNPDIYCNRYVKFDHFLKHAQDKFGAEAIATGHYARSSFGDYLDTVHQGGAKLLESADAWKDQTFFLSQIRQDALTKTMFPLGCLLKDDVRRVALESGMARIVRKDESTGICFIGKRDFAAFISEYVSDKPGVFLDLETRARVGAHRGQHHWTIGQRTRIQGAKARSYVAAKEEDGRTILVASGLNHPSLFCVSLSVGPFHWIHHTPKELLVTGQLECHFRFQHGHPLVRCLVTPSDDAGFILRMEEPLRAVTPGQFAVLYKGGECLGSAPIVAAGPSLYHNHNKREDEQL